MGKEEAIRMKMQTTGEAQAYIRTGCTKKVVSKEAEWMGDSNADALLEVMLGSVTPGACIHNP